MDKEGPKQSVKPTNTQPSDLPDLASVVSGTQAESLEAPLNSSSGSLLQPIGLSDAPTAQATKKQSATPLSKRGSWSFKHILTVIVMVVLFFGIGLYLLRNPELIKNGIHQQASLGSLYNTDKSPLENIKQSDQLVVTTDSTASLTVNGHVNVNGGLVIAATGQLTNFSQGQIYYSKTNNKLYFYNGRNSVDLTQQTAAGGVTSLQGLTGAVQLKGGNGITVSGATISNNGVLSIAAGDPTLSIGNDGQGHYTITNNSTASTVLLQSTTPGSPQIGNINLTGTVIAGSFSGDGSNLTSLDADAVSSGTLSDLRLSPNVTLAGNTFNGPNQIIRLDPSGDLPTLSAINLTNLNVSNATAGTLSDLRLSTNVTLAGNTFNGPNQLVELTSGGGLPVVNASNLTGLNASALTNGTVDDSRLSGNVALLDGNQAFSGTNTFGAGVITSSLTSTGALTVGSTGQSLVLQGNNTTTLVAHSGGHSTTVGFNGTPVGNLAYNFDAAAGTGVYTICTTVGNCAGSGGGVTTPGGTTNKLARFTGPQAIGDSLISDNGATVTVKNLSDTNNAFQIQNAAGTSNLLVANTVATRIGIGTAVPSYTLDVNGDINSATGLRVGGNLVCNATGCAASGSSGFYIQNGTSQQTSANFNIQSAAASSVGAIIAGAVGQTADLLRLNQAGTTVAKVTPGGDLDITGMYKVNGNQISSANLSNNANLAKLDGLQVFTGSNTFQNAVDSTTAFQIQDSTGSSNLLVADTTHTRIGIGTATPGYTLDVNGDINIVSGGSYRIGGVAICGVVNYCAPASGSSFYVQNSTAQQTNANFNIQSVNPTAIGGIIRGASGQTADIFRLQAGDGTNVLKVAANGNLTVQGDGQLSNLNITGATTLVNLGVTGTTTLANLTVGGASTLNGILTVNANVVVGANSSLIVTGGVSFPVSPTSGQIYYRSDTNQLYVYTGSKWQADRSTANKIVAASNSQDKEKADFVGDGTNDQNAINAAIAALPSTGGSVVLLDGVYNVAAPITIAKSNVVLNGQGNSTILKRMYDGGSNDGLITLMNDNITIQNLKIDGNKTAYSNSNNTGVIASSMRQNIAIYQTTVTNNAGHGLYAGWNILGGANFGSWNVSNSIVTGNDMNGISFDRVDLTASNNNVSNNIGNGIQNTGCSNGTGGGFRRQFGSTITGNTANYNGGKGLSIDCMYSTITGNTASLNTDIGIYVGGIGTVASGNTASYNTSYGMASFNSSLPGTTLISNTLDHNSQGIQIRSYGIAKSNYLTNNGNGIAIAGSNASVVNNILVNSGGISTGGGNLSSNSITGNNITTSPSTSWAINLASGNNYTYVSNNTFSPGMTIIDNATGTIYVNQQDFNGNIVTRAQAGIGLNGTSASYSLQNAGSFVQGGLAVPAPPVVTTGGTAGATTWGYKVTAYDGLGETLASTEKQITTGNAALNVTNYNQIVPARVSGAVSYRVYRTTAGGTPASTGYIGSVAGGASSFFLNDTGQAATTALPTTNTTGNVTLTGNLGVANASPANKIAVNTATTADGLAQVLVATGGPANKGLVIQGAVGQTADLFQVQSYSGAIGLSYSADGSLSVYQNNKLTLWTGGNAYAPCTNSNVCLYGTDTGDNRTAVKIVGALAGNTISFGGTGGAQSYALKTNSSAANVGIIVQGAASQTANLQEWQNSSGAVVASINSDGTRLTLIANNANPATFTSISGQPLVISQGNGVTLSGNTIKLAATTQIVSSDSSRWALSTSLYGAVGAPIVSIGSGAGGSKAGNTVQLAVLGANSQTYDLQQWQSSTGSVLASISATGSLTVVNATVNGTLTVTSAATFNNTLTVNGHIITGNTSGSTTAVAGAAATCAAGSPVVSVSGNDTSGKVTITTGTSCAAGVLATVNFANAYGSAPRLNLTPANAASASLQYFSGSSATNSFTIDSATAPADGTTYIYSYFAAQ